MVLNRPIAVDLEYMGEPLEGKDSLYVYVEITSATSYVVAL